MITRLLPFLSGWKLWLWLAPTLALALSAAAWRLHSSGYHSGYEKASLECAAEREAGKDDVLAEMLRLQKESAVRQQEMLTLNRSIDVEVRKEDEIRTDRIETIIRETPVVIRDNCRRDYSYVQLRNDLARAGLTPGGSVRGDSDRASGGAESGVPESPSNTQPE